jgi:2-polyprenyl-3-methyl-5-hydroxy-6-metoxy-1,4-benzoquinol methylase
MTNSLIIFIAVTLIAIFITLFMMDSIKSVFGTALILILISYIVVLGLDKLTAYNVITIKEGFVNNTETGGEGSETVNETEAKKSKYEWLVNEDLFDDFYASVFTKLTQNEKLIQAESAICMEEFTKKNSKDQLTILDAGCGIGIAACSFAKQGAGNVVGIDRSQAMIRYAKGTTLPGTTLTELQRQNVEFRQMDLVGAGAASAAEFTDACLLYFTVYYFQDLDMLFRNLALWVKPGGTLAIEAVNKYKFEPVLDSANQWVGFSPQKYSKERITKSKVVFDKFEYEAVFDLDDPRAEFRETFRFKDGSTRRQKHILHMPSIQEIVQKAQRNGWTYSKYVDLTPMSFPYGYILFFNRNPE